MLTDGVITLRPPSEDDADEIYEGCQDPEVPKWTNVPSPYLRQYASEWIAITRSEREAGRSHAFIARLADGMFAASCSLMELDKHPHYAEIGYWVAKPARRQGVASRAIGLLKEFGVDELGLTRIEMLIHEDNGPSRRTAERAGFRNTGERRPAPRHEPPGPPDHLVYAWSAE